MSKENRIKLIKKIQQKRKAYLITYITSDRPNTTAMIAPDVVRQIYDLILGFKPFRYDRLDLFLYTRGGDVNVPWQIVSMIRELFKEFNVLVPYRCHSAGTIIALGADSILMGPKGELSPIDVTIGGGPHNPKDPDTKEKLPVNVEDVTGFFSLLDRFGNVTEERRIDAFLSMMDSVSPLALGLVNRTLEQTKLIATRLLETRKKPFSKDVNEKIAKKISSEIFSHQHSISRTEAIKQVGIEHVKPAGDIEPIMWELLTLYEQELKINEPFYPEDIMAQSDEDEKTFRDHKYVYLETVKRTKVFKLDIKMKKIRQNPPPMQYSPQIALPPIQVPSELQNSQQIQNFIQQWLQGNLPGIINACFDKYIKQFPVQAYQRTDLNRQWMDE